MTTNTYMPSDEEIRDAWFTVAPFLRHSTHAILDPEPIRALITTAVEKALAEQAKGYNCPICGGIEPDSGKPCACAGSNDVRVAFDCLHSDWGRLVAERSEQEARHKREVVEAKIEMLHAHGREWIAAARLAALRAELAALTTSEPETDYDRFKKLHPDLIEQAERELDEEERGKP